MADVTDSSTKDNGALVVEGGVGIEKSVNIGGNLGVTGVSTFTGIGTFISDLFVGGDLHIKDDLFVDEMTIRNLKVTGVSTFQGDINQTGEYLLHLMLELVVLVLHQILFQQDLVVEVNYILTHIQMV